MAANQGAVPINYTTLAGKVRVLVGDTDAQPLDPPVAGQGTYAWYSDEELEALGEIYGGNARRVAIVVLGNVAISKAMILGKWQSDDLSVDGPAILNAIEKTIARLSRELEDELSGEEYFDIIAHPGHHVYPEGMIRPYVWW